MVFSSTIDHLSRLLQYVPQDSVSDATHTALFCNALKLVMASADDYRSFLHPSAAACFHDDSVALAIEHIPKLSCYAYVTLSAFLMQKQSSAPETVAKLFHPHCS